MQKAFVVTAAMFVAFCNFGVFQAYGSLFTATLEKFDEGRPKTSLVHTLMGGIIAGIGVIVGYLIKRTSLQLVSSTGSVLMPLGFIISFFATSVTYLLFSISIVSGIGISFTYISAVLVINSVISDKSKTTALSLQNVACGLPGIVVPYLFSWLNTEYGLLGTLLIYGGISLNNIAAALLFSGVTLNDKSTKDINNTIETVTTKNESSTGKTLRVRFDANQQDGDFKEEENKSVIQETIITGTDSSHRSQRKTYIVFVLGVGLVLSNTSGFQSLFQDIGVYKNMSTSQTLSCIAAFNILGTCGRFLPFIFQRFSGNPFVSAITAGLSGVLGQIIILLTSQHHWLLIGYALTGMADGGTSSTISVVIFKILRPESQAVGFGLLLTLVGVLLIPNGPIYMAIYDLTKSYNLVVCLTIAFLAIGTILFICCYLLYKITARRINLKRQLQSMDTYSFEGNMDL